MPFKVSEFLDDPLTRAIDFKVERRVFICPCKMSDDPRKLVSVEFRRSELGNLFHAVRIAAEDLNCKTISPVRRAIRRVRTDDIIGRVNGFFPYLEGSKTFRRFKNFSILKVISKSIPVTIERPLLCHLHCVSDTAVREERTSGHHKGVVLGRRKLLEHQGIILDPFSQLPPPPGNLPSVDLNAVEFLDVLGPFLLLGSQATVPVSLVHIAVTGNRVKLVTPPAAEDRSLGLGAFGCDVHVMEHVEATGRALEHIEAVGVRFC